MGPPIRPVCLIWGVYWLVLVFPKMFGVHLNPSPHARLWDLGAPFGHQLLLAYLAGVQSVKHRVLNQLTKGLCFEYLIESILNIH
jgi:hypothetical protein